MSLLLDSAIDRHQHSEMKQAANPTAHQIVGFVNASGLHSHCAGLERVMRLLVQVIHTKAACSMVSGMAMASTLGAPRALCMMESTLTTGGRVWAP